MVSTSKINKKADAKHPHNPRKPLWSQVEY